MKELDKRGETNVLLIPLILFVLLFVGVAAFSIWAFKGRQDYKNNTDKKVAAAVSADRKVVQATDAKNYAEAAKQPLKTYVGPAAFGSVHVSYPKTWSALADTSSSGTPLDAYFSTDVVPGLDDPASIFALRVQVASETYDQVMSSFNGQVQSNQVKVTPYTLPSVPSVIGSRIDGQITSSKQGSMIVLPLRNETLEVWTESNQFMPDFNNIILPHFSFSP